MEEKRPILAKQLEVEIDDYFNRVVPISPDHDFSQAKLVRRISLFENHIYPKGKFTKKGEYKYWYDIQTPRIDAEVKNIDFDTKNIEVYSPIKLDELPSLIINLKNAEYLRDTGQAEELNSAIEEGAGWGNVVWKRVAGGYERVDLRNFYVVNQTARSLKETAAIERHQLSQSDIKGKKNWKNVDKVLRDCGQFLYKRDQDSTQRDTTTPVYSIYERNGEVSLEALKEYRGQPVEKGDEYIFKMAKIIAAGTEGTSGAVKIKYILFAGEITEMPYKEFHRGRYKGRWWREGLYELLFDVQVRANEVGNQIAQGLQYASKVIFTGDDKQIIQNVLTDLSNGDYIKSKDLRQVEVRMQGFDQLANEWNRLLELANEIANSREIVQGEGVSGQPFRLGALLNSNANKLFDFIREKLAIPLSEIFEQWIVPEHIKNITAEEVLRLTGNSQMMDRLRELIVESWYLENLVAIGPHSPEVAEALKSQKIQELGKGPIFMKEFKKVFENYKARVSVVITGENTKKDEERESFAQFTQFETDPIRRSAMIEEAMRRSGIDVGGLPKSPPERMMPPEPKPTQSSAKESDFSKIERGVEVS